MIIRRAPRLGFSLLEVLLSMAIFLIALVGISELLNICAQRAFDISLVNKADQLLEDRMNAVLGGSVPITGQSETAFDQDPEWVWSVDSQADNTPNLYRVTIHVRWQAANESETWTLSRMMLDPAQRGTIEAPSSSSSTTTPMGGQ